MKLQTVLVAYAAAACLAGCAQFWKAAPPLLDTAQCVLRNQSKPKAWLFANCGATEENWRALQDLVSVSREAGTCK